MKTAKKNHLQEEVAELLNFKSANEMPVVLVRGESGKPNVEYKLMSVLLDPKLINDKALNSDVDVNEVYKLQYLFDKLSINTKRTQEVLQIVFRDFFSNHKDASIFDDFIKIYDIIGAINVAEKEIFDLKVDLDNLSDSL